MIITVKLFGTLSLDFPGYDSQKGLLVNMPDGSRLRDLLTRLDIPLNRGRITAVMAKRLAKQEDCLKDGTEVTLFQPMAGG